MPKITVTCEARVRPLPSLQLAPRLEGALMTLGLASRHHSPLHISPGEQPECVGMERNRMWPWTQARPGLAWPLPILSSCLDGGRKGRPHLA